MIYFLVKTENLLKFLSLNERVDGEAATRPGILHFFGQRKFYFCHGKVRDFEMGYLWQSCVKQFLFVKFDNFFRWSWLD